MDPYRSADPASLWASPTVLSLDEAILYTLVYADVFSYPLTLAEVHRYLIGFRSTVEDVADALRELPIFAAGRGYYALPGHASLVDVRERRARVAAAMGPRARAYGGAISRLPFVRMVALTGALSMGNVEPNDDFDFLVVTSPGRVWVTRMFIIQSVVKAAARHGDEVCPNFLLAEDAVSMQERTLFHAHEVAQMVPLHGFDVYRSLRAANDWVEHFLPNAQGPPLRDAVATDGERRYRTLLEVPLSSPLGSWLDRREMARVSRKLAASSGREELSLSPERCKGHTGSHGHTTLSAFVNRLRRDQAALYRALATRGTSDETR